MSFDKTKFTANPQQDAEGFTDYEARCLGCPNTQPCPRSGECLRYNSPLRHVVELPLSAAAKLTAHTLGSPTEWSQITDEELDYVHDWWCRQAVHA